MDCMDNRYSNLRKADKSLNAMNIKARRDNTTGVKGLCYCPRYNRYIAAIKVNGIRHKKHFLPEDKALAEQWLIDTRTILHKEFARHE